jgi:hypothetical protein
MSADRYFGIAAGALERINDLEIGKFLRENAGKEVRTADLVRAAVHETGGETRPAYTFICRGPDGDERLSEVWIAMSYIGPWLFPQLGTTRLQRLPAGHLCPEDGTIMIYGAP